MKAVNKRDPKLTFGAGPSHELSGILHGSTPKRQFHGLAGVTKFEAEAAG
jgi:hypothetical protein